MKSFDFLIPTLYNERDKSPLPCHMNENTFYIYLPQYKKYLSISPLKRSVFEYFNSSHYNKIISHTDDLSKTIEALPHQKLFALKEWLEHSTSLAAADKSNLLDLVQQLEQIEFNCVSVVANKQLLLPSLIPSSFTEFVTEEAEKYKKHEKIVVAIKEIFAKYPSLGGYRIQDRATSKPFSKTSSLLPVTSLVPSILKPTTSELKILKYLKECSSEIVVTSSAEDKKTTAPMFIVVTENRNNKSGFLGKNDYYGPLNSAEIFYDVNKAKRAASARSVSKYEIWSVGVHFKQSELKAGVFSSAQVLEELKAQREKELLEEMIKSQDYQNLKQLNEEYRQLLLAHNLLASEPAIVKKNKI